MGYIITCTTPSVKCPRQKPNAPAQRTTPVRVGASCGRVGIIANIVRKNIPTNERYILCSDVILFVVILTPYLFSNIQYGCPTFLTVVQFNCTYLMYLQVMSPKKKQLLSSGASTGWKKLTIVLTVAYEITTGIEKPHYFRSGAIRLTGI